jgi:hypothetical protein
VPAGRLIAGQRGSVADRGMHIGNPENETMLGFDSSAVNAGLLVYAVANNPEGVFIRRVGPPEIFIVPSSPTLWMTPVPPTVRK